MEWLQWVLFSLLLVLIVLFDLGLGQRRPTPTLREAFLRTGFYVGLALAFGAWVAHSRGGTAGAEYLAGYLVEYSLSVDNVFVWIAIFSYFAVPEAYRPRLLLWGVLGALVMRLLMILAGAALLERFHWLLYVFGGVLILTGLKFLREREETGDLERNPVLRGLRRILPITDAYDGMRFFVRRDGRLWATPLFVALVLIEAADLVFAVDSIPAIFGITRDPFIVYTSNAFAIIGLRSLYYVFGAILPLIRYLRYGLAATLLFIGMKMILVDVLHIPPVLSLAILTAILGSSVLASFLFPGRGEAGEAPARPEAGGRPAPEHASAREE